MEHLPEDIGASFDYINLTWVAFSVPMLFSWVGGRIADNHNRYRLMPAGFLISAVAWMMYGITKNLTLFMIVNILEGFAIACSYPAKQAFLVQVSPPPLAWHDHRSGDHRHAACDTAGNADGPGHLRRDSRIHPDLGGVLAVVGLAATAPSLRRAWAEAVASGRRVSFAEAECMALEGGGDHLASAAGPESWESARRCSALKRHRESEDTRFPEGALRRNCRGIRGKAGAPKTRSDPLHA